MTTIDLSTDSFFQDPYPTYRMMRELKTGHWLGFQDRADSGGMWMFSRYKDVIAILRDTQNISLNIKRLVPEPQWTAFDYMLLYTDPPDHTRLRALISAPFNNAGVRKLENMITGVADQLIDSMMERGEVEFQREFALPFPVKVICKLLGAPFEDAECLRNWTVDLMKGLDSTLINDELLKRQGRVLKDMTEYFSHLLARPQQPAGTIIDRLSSMSDVAACSPQEALGQCLLLLIAGHETTVNLLGNGMLTLLSNPRELEKLRREPGLVDRAIDEMLRYEAPLQRATFRVVTSPVRFRSQEIQPGRRISAVLGAANRDPGQFAEPDRFDISRKPNRHVSFGAGIHRCLGENLARTEARIAFTRLLQRLPAIKLATANPRWQSRSLFRALETLPLHLG